MFTFEIDGEPQGKERPRKGPHGFYTPTKTRNYELRVQAEFLAQGGKFIGQRNEVEVDITAYFQIPKSASVKEKSLMEMGAIQPIKKPDCDNIIKIICDALNNTAYRDDSQVVDVRCVKKYSNKPHVKVTIKERGKNE